MVSRLQKTVFVCLLIALMIPALVVGQGYNQQLGQNRNIDWTRHVIKCTGIGAPDPNLPMAAQRATALRVAKIDAMRNALEVVKGVQLTSETTVENSMMVSDQIRTTVDGAIRGAQVIDTRYMSSGDVEVDIEVPFTGIMMDALLPEDFGGGVLATGGQLLCPCCGQPWPQGKPVPAGVTLIQSGGGGGAVDNLYTGLIIDARGLGVTPAMAPKVLDEDGDDVYSAKFISRDYAVDIGMTGYEKDINRARMNERVTDNPLVVQAVRASGPSKSDVVISSVDALKIHNAASNLNFLKHCKVMFVLD
ncbi:LPP20 family lipoprotein [bacterium]|nr:LPP20 family lipoprotein [bacterium]